MSARSVRGFLFVSGGLSARLVQLLVVDDAFNVWVKRWSCPLPAR